MTENEKNTQKEGYQNLKSIHGLQVGGAIQNVLRDLRNTRHIAEQLAKQVSDAKKTKAAQVQPQKEVDVVLSTKSQETVATKVEVQEEKPPVQNKNFQERPSTREKSFSQNNRQDFSQKSGTQRPFVEKKQFAHNAENFGIIQIESAIKLTDVQKQKLQEILKLFLKKEKTK